MANNPNVNKVVYGNQTVMDITDTTAEEGDVVSGKTFYKASGARSTGSAVIPDISNCYQTTDTAKTAIADNDYFPYDTSASGKRKTLWSNIKAKLNEIFYRRSEASILGAKNLLPYPYSSTTKTQEGVTFTDNGDGTVLINIPQTATNKANFWCYAFNIDYMNLSDGTYIISKSGHPNIACSVTYYLNSTWKKQINATENDETFVINKSDTSYNNIGVVIYVPANTTSVSNLLIKPMIRLASDPDDTWQPYAMTNKELTGKVGTLAPLASPALTGTPTAPTATAGTNTTQIATTAFVQENKTAVIDGLTSSSRTDALSARCGYYLENKDGHVVQRIIQGSGKYRFPYSGYSEYIQTGSIIIPVSDPSSSGTPYKFKSLEVHSTYNSQTGKYEGYAELDIASDLPFNTMVELLIFNVGGFYG